jgi:zinc/manganese transport system substrate-binding protein
MSKKILIIILVIIFVGVGFVLMNKDVKKDNGNSSNKLSIVAGENFWGSIASQISGNTANITDIISDPNADPHEYSSNANTAREFANANYVILNGAGYDSWGIKLLNANQNPNRKVLIVSDLLGRKDGDNPHFWYSPNYVNDVAIQIEKDLISINPAEKSYYETQYATLQKNLSEYQNKIALIKDKCNNCKVSATEDIFKYLADVAGLDLVSPEDFTKAVAEGNDPSPSSIIEFQNQLKSGEVKALVYNEQTVTPLTETMKTLAKKENIPLVSITEIVEPANASFEDWMNAEVTELQNALRIK